MSKRTAIHALRDAIRSHLRTFPGLRPLDDGNGRGQHTKKMERYQHADGWTLAHEVNLRTLQHIWVLASRVDAAALADIPQKFYPGYRPGERSGRHSNIDTIPGFRVAAAYRFTPRTAEEARLVLQGLS